MKAGKPTELPSSPLDTLSPGPAFDKAAAWNNLQQRLEKKKTGVLFPWKWAAAAALLISATLLLWPSAKKETSIVKTNDGKKNPAPVIQTGGKAVPGTNSQPETATFNNTDIPVNTADFISQQKTVNTIQPVKYAVHVTDTLTRITAEEEPGLTLSPEPAAVNKKLRVVYNNELAVTDPEEEVVASAAEETENPIPFFRKAKLNRTLKADNILPDEITPRRKKGLLFFSPSIKPKD